jgi:hypothetical protein
MGGGLTSGDRDGKVFDEKNRSAAGNAAGRVGEETMA